ncbi:MAG: hypothetical protein QXO86_04265 [Nitrososphaerota archaeon]
MKTFRGEEEEEIRDIVQLLNEECSSGATILVEGVGDRGALIERGVKGKIYTLNELLRIVENGLDCVKVIPLLDLDREGESILRWVGEKFSSYLQLDYSLRSRLRKTQRYRRGLRSIQQIFMAP